MAMGQVLEFSGGTMAQYDAVTSELGIKGDQGWPSGLLTHSAGATADGFIVIESWESADAWNDFFASALQAAFEKVGGIPQPKVTQFEVKNSFTRS
jgi:heme-degrading monooxygenase HmoA